MTDPREPRNTYLIAEIGQNHQGSVEAAKDMVEIAAFPSPHVDPTAIGEGVNAVKLCKRDLACELTREAESAPYTGRNAFAATYGEHRERLELSPADHAAVASHARSIGLDVIETVCAPSALDQILDRFTPDALKIASRDLTNPPLLEAVADTGLPVILSTGMIEDYMDLRRALEITGEDVTVLHCLSQYPSDPSLLNLGRIRTLKELWPTGRIGFSDHSIGLVASVVAVAMGAEVIEKHVTLDRAMRGSDHLGALERDGVYKWVRDVRRAEQMCVYVDDAERLEAIRGTRTRLARSVSSRVTIPAGSTITEEMLVPLSPGDGIRWQDLDKVVGRRAATDIPAKSTLTTRHIERDTTISCGGVDTGD